MNSEWVLQLQHVSVQYGQRQVLKDIDFTVAKGEFVGVIGPNGAGKTTLLRVILGLLRATAGSVRLAGQPVRKGSRSIGYVPQSVSLDADTPLCGRDLVAFGLDGHRFGIPWPSRTRRQRIDAALAAVDACAYADKPVGKLSGGERQRLLIAQALLTEPELLLLDEPLSNLDIRSAHEVVRCVSKISKERNMAVMMVAHDMNPLLSAMDQVLYLAEGRALKGEVNEVIRSDVLSRLYGYAVEVLHVGGRILVAGGEERTAVGGVLQRGAAEEGQVMLR